MPAQPNNPSPLDALLDFKGVVEKLQTAAGTTGWWDNVDRTLLEYPGHEIAAANTGLFFRAAQTGKAVYLFDSVNMSFLLPANCENSVTETRSLVGKLVKEIGSIGLSCIQQRKPADDDIIKVSNLYSNTDTICSLTITVTGNNLTQASIEIASFDEKIVDRIKQISEKYLVRNAGATQLFTVSEDDEGRMTLVNIGSPGINLVRENYNAEVVSGFDYVVSQLNSSSPFGRLVIMHGPTGSGKTHLLKGLFSSLNLAKRKFIFLQPEFLFKHSVSALTRLLIGAAENGDSLILLIEDADDCLIPRQVDNMVAISTLLNLADGFIGSMLDIRVIATTNANKLSIDSALKRPGRLCKIIDVGLLKPEQANSIVLRAVGKSGKFKTSVTLAEVYAEIAVEQGRADIGLTKPEHGVGFSK